MPASVLAFSASHTVDTVAGSGRLISDSGVISAPGSFDTIEREIWLPSESSLANYEPGRVTHPRFANMHLESVPYRFNADGSINATLRYIGLQSGLPVSTPFIPAAPDERNMRISRSLVPKQVDFAGGELTVLNNFCGFGPATNSLPSTVTIYREVVSASWISRSHVTSPTPSANMFAQWGDVPSWLGWLNNPTRNLPWGMVPNNLKSEPIVTGVDLYTVTCEFMATPQYGP